MKTRLLGLAILAVVIIAAVVYSFIDRKPGTTEITGFVGGEKIEQNVLEAIDRIGVAAIFGGKDFDAEESPVHQAVAVQDK